MSGRLDMTHGFLREIQSVLYKRSKDDQRFKDSEISLLEADIENYVESVRPSIRQAIQDPHSLTGNYLEVVAEVIVSRAWEDPAYHVTAAKLCAHIVQKEQQLAGPQSSLHDKFLQGMLSTCSELLSDWDKLRETKMMYWLSFVRFLWQSHLMVRVDGKPVQELTSLLTKSLLQLATPPCVQNFDELEVLSSVLCESGCSIQNADPAQMKNLMVLLRNAILDPMATEVIRGMLLPLIELHACQWDLSSEAKAFYFSM